MLKQRILAVLAAAAITAGVTFAVVRTVPPTFREGSVREGVIYELTGVAPDTAVAAACGKTAPLDLYVYMMRSSAGSLDQLMQYYTGASLNWDEPLPDGSSVTELVRADTIQTIKQVLVIEGLAGRYGVGMTEAQRQEIAAEREQTIAAVGEEKYGELLAQAGMTEELYARIAAINCCAENLNMLYLTPGSELYASDDTLTKYAAQQDYITADHILITTGNPMTGEALSGGALAAKQQLAEELLARIDAGEDFAALADEYSEDPGRLANPDGYTFTRGRMVAEFEEAAYALSEGGHSGLVKTDYGFHIILRKPLNTAAAAETVRPEYFMAVLQQKTDDTAIRTNDILETLDLRALYEEMKP